MFYEPILVLLWEKQDKNIQKIFHSGDIIMKRRRFLGTSAAATAAVPSLLLQGCAANKDYDLLVSGGEVFDGSGTAGIEADVAVKDGRIVKIASNIPQNTAAEIIDAKGLAVAPGFIDVHTHTDHLLLINPNAESKIRQGVTTEIGGNCGSSLFPLSDADFEEQKRILKREYDFDLDWNDLNGFFGKLEAGGIALNFGTLVGHGTIRNAVMGQVDRAPLAEELAHMSRLVREHITAGAFGMSSGLYYAPGSFAKQDEMVVLCRELATFDAVYASHMRDEGDYVLESIDEAISTAQATGVRLQISHLKAQYPRNYAKISGALAKIEDAKNGGLNILADRYPYHASSTSLGSFFPRWAQTGSDEDFVNLLATKVRERELRDHISNIEEKLQSWGNVVISSVVTEKNRHLEGKNILGAAKEAGKPCYEFIRDLLIEEQNQVAMINFSMSEDNLKRVLSHPLVVIGSDGNSLAPYGVLGKGKPHPRSYGTFVRVLGKYVREEGVLTLPQAIMKMTSMSAAQFGLDSRGLLKEGFHADLAVFDPNTVIDRADWLNPHQYPAGMEYVVVNGRIVIEGGEHTGALPGRILKHAAV